MLSTSSVLGKLIFAVDEAFIQANIVIERIKYLSTANKFKAEGKGKERYETDFFAKFILCSNNEDTFLKIDEEEIRFWVRKLPPLENDNTNLLKELNSEIPAFLFFLINRHLSTACKSRILKRLKTECNLQLAA